MALEKKYEQQLKELLELRKTANQVNLLKQRLSDIKHKQWCEYHATLNDPNANENIVEYNYLEKI